MSGPRLTFCGAAGEVTGSCHLIETGQARVLVDCGMFQGGREADDKNRAPFPFDARRIDCVLLTHAHIDHSGLLPRLAAAGFRGRIHCTPPTADLAEVMLLDAAYIQEKEAEWARAPRHRNRRDGPHDDEPLYTIADAERCLARFEPLAYERMLEPAPGLRCRFREAGHILGSASIELWLETAGVERKLVFSGDLGQPGHPLMRDPAAIESADWLIVESTYGNRLHKPLDATLEELATLLTDTLEARRGNIVVPAFAVGRTQELLYVLTELRRQRRVPHMEIYVDSPMAIKATEITLRHWRELEPEAAGLLEWLRANPGSPRIHFAQSVEDSLAINEIRSGALIISASGMCDAGRVKHHLRRNLPRPESTVLITGFQAQGTLGRRLVDGARWVRLFGQDVPVRAQLHTVGGLSAHADQSGLLGWLGQLRHPPRQAYVVHGEQGTAAHFAGLIRERWGWNVTVPVAGQSFEIG
jgi:metallo-beta-lactamase family protein